MKGWHFAAAGPNGTPVLRDGTLAVAGTVRVKGPLVLCEWGLHASERALDALKYAPGPWLSLVELSGEVVRGEDKAVATARTAGGYRDVSSILHEFAVRCAVRALERVQVPDERSWAACDLTLGWLMGVVADETLCDAADDAADADYGDAYAANAAAYAAAYAAANATAYAAACAAADAAAYAADDAAYAAANEKEAQNTELEKMLRTT